MLKMLVTGNLALTEVEHQSYLKAAVFETFLSFFTFTSSLFFVLTILYFIRTVSNFSLIDSSSLFFDIYSFKMAVLGLSCYNLLFQIKLLGCPSVNKALFYR